MALFPAMLEDVLRDLNVLFAVMDDLVDFARFPPFNRLETISRLPDVQGSLSEGFELQELLTGQGLDVVHDVKDVELLEVQAVGLKDDQVEPADVVTDHEAFFAKLIELLDLVLVEGEHLVRFGVEGAGDRDLEFINMTPSSDVLHEVLGLKVNHEEMAVFKEEARRDNVFRERNGIQVFPIAWIQADAEAVGVRQRGTPLDGLETR